MKRYQRILICLDREEQAPQMLAYVRAIARLAGSREIHLLGVAGDGASGAGDAADGSSPANGRSRKLLPALADQHLEGISEEALRFEEIHEAPLIGILRRAHEAQVDLIVMDRHCGAGREADDEATVARRVTRKATCSVLVLPEEFQVRADTILVPVRDSECSAAALDVACGIAAATGAKVIPFNVFQVHTGYSRAGTTLHEHQARLQAAARRECERLLQRVDTRAVDVRCRCAPDLHGRPVPLILETAEEVSADLVVIGARGRTGAAGVLLGSVTERLIRQSPLPVLAVKKKGECLGVLRALLTLAGEG